MPRYRTEFGVVVNIPEGKAARINGLTPVDAVPPAPREAAAPKKAAPRKAAVKKAAPRKAVKG